MSKNKNGKKKAGKWNVSKNAHKYFDPHYDDKFKAEHPVLYWLTVAAIILCVLVGPFIYIWLCSVVEPDGVFSFLEILILIIGFISSFGISIGICNLLMILHKQYLGHKVTLYSFLLGALGSAVFLALLWLI